MTREEFKALIKSSRTKYIPDANSLIYEAFMQALSLSQPQSIHHLAYNHTSELINLVRQLCWDNYLHKEQQMNAELICQLFPVKLLRSNTPKQTQELIAVYMPLLYDLALSTTQSRRSRTGKEFEFLLELILSSCVICADPQGKIGPQANPKNIDLLVPSALHYKVDPSHCIIISAKTSIRERWQEVVEESHRLNNNFASMFLVTLDKKISPTVIDYLYKNKIILVVDKDVRDKLEAKNNSRILSFEELLQHIQKVTTQIEYRMWPKTELQQLLCTYQQRLQTEQRAIFKTCYQLNYESILSQLQQSMTD